MYTDTHTIDTHTRSGHAHDDAVLCHCSCVVRTPMLLLGMSCLWEISCQCACMRASHIRFRQSGGNRIDRDSTCVCVCVRVHVFCVHVHRILHIGGHILRCNSCGGNIFHRFPPSLVCVRASSVSIIHVQFYTVRRGCVRIDVRLCVCVCFSFWLVVPYNFLHLLFAFLPNLSCLLACFNSHTHTHSWCTTRRGIGVHRMCAFPCHTHFKWFLCGIVYFCPSSFDSFQCYFHPPIHNNFQFEVKCFYEKTCFSVVCIMIFQQRVLATVQCVYIYVLKNISNGERYVENWKSNKQSISRSS